MKNYFKEEEAIYFNEYVKDKLKTISTYIYMLECNSVNTSNIRSTLGIELMKYASGINTQVDCKNFILGYLNYISDIRDYSIIKFVNYFSPRVDEIVRNFIVSDILRDTKLKCSEKIDITLSASIYLHNLYINIDKYFNDENKIDIFNDLRSDLEITLLELIDNNDYSDIIGKIRDNNLLLLKEKLEYSYLNYDIQEFLGILDSEEISIYIDTILNDTIGNKSKSLDNIRVKEVCNTLNEGVISSYFKLRSLRSKAVSYSNTTKSNVRKKVRTF